MTERNWRIDHTTMGVADIDAAQAFYDAALGALGMVPLFRLTCDRQPFEGEGELGAIGYGVDYPIFWIDVFRPHSARDHTALRARSRDEVEAFYKAAMAAGGSDNGAPGLRSGGYPEGYYAAFVLDPDGNNVGALFREA